MNDLAKEREAFEAWIAKDCGDLSTFGHPPHRHYKNSAVNQSWVAWQARAALSTPAQEVPDPCIVLWQAMNEAEKYGQRTDDKLIVKFLREAGYALAAAPPQPALSEDARDAARYRWLAAHCRTTPEHWGGRWSIVVEGPEPERQGCEAAFDAAIDAAMAQGVEK